MKKVLANILLLNDDTNDFKEKEYQILSEFYYMNYYCVFIRDGEKFILVFDKNNYSHVEIFDSFERLLCYVVKNILLSEGESIV